MEEADARAINAQPWEPTPGLLDEHHQEEKIWKGLADPIRSKTSQMGRRIMVDEGKLHQFIGQMLGDLGGAASISMVRIGDSLGLYRALHSKGSMTCEELAQETGVHDRYLREWLSHQAASNYLSYDPATQRFTLPPEQAMVFAIEDSPVYMM